MRKFLKRLTLKLILKLYIFEKNKKQISEEDYLLVKSANLYLKEMKELDINEIDLIIYEYCVLLKNNN